MSHPAFQGNPEVISPSDAGFSAGSDTSFQEHIQSQLTAPGSTSPRKLSTSVAKGEALLNDHEVHTKLLHTIRIKKGYIIDMDGVIYHVCFICNCFELFWIVSVDSILCINFLCCSIG